MLIPLQWVVPTLIPLQMHSSLAFLLPHRFRSDSGEVTELPQPSRPSAFHPRALFARLSSFIHCFSRENNAPDALRQPSTPSRVDPTRALTPPFPIFASTSTQH